MQIKELGHVVLYVTNLMRSADFYRDTLGFREIARGSGTALYSSGRTHHELLLIEIGGSPKSKHAVEPGLYHIGFKIGDSDEELRSAHRELLAKGVTVVGVGDHTVTHSLYVLDPDGNELELYVDTTDKWKSEPDLIMRPVKHLDLE